MGKDPSTKRISLTRVLIVGVLFTLLVLAALAIWPLMNLQSLSGPATAQPSVPDEFVVVLHNYTKEEVSELESKLLGDLDATEADVEALQSQREQIPAAERNRIPTDENVLTQDALSEQYLRYRLRELDYYANNTSDSGEAKRRGKAFLTQYAKFAAGAPDSLTPAGVQALGQSALDAGATDIMLRAYHAGMLRNLDRYEQAMGILEGVFSPIMRGEFPALTKYLVCSWLWELDAQTRGPTLADVPPAVIATAVAYLGAEAEYENQRLILRPIMALFNRLPADAKMNLYGAALANPDIDPWVMHMLAGRYYASLAWKQRGTRYAMEVRPEQWAGFRAYLPRGMAHLRRAWQIHPEYPEAATQLVSVAMAGESMRWSPRDWFNEAVHAQIDFTPAYTAFQRATLPRWGGSYREMLEFADECIRTERWDTSIPANAVTILFAIERDLDDPDDLVAIPGAVAFVKRFQKKLGAAAKKGSHTFEDIDSVWASFASILVTAGDYQAAREIFEQWGQDFRQRNFDWRFKKMTSVRGQAYAHTGPAVKLVQKVEEALASERADDTPPAYFEALQKHIDEASALDDRPELQPYLRDLAAVVDQLARFYRDEWVELPAEKEMIGWYASGQVQVDEDHTIKVTSQDHSPSIQLTPLADFPLPFVVEAEFSGCPFESEEPWMAIALGSANCGDLYLDDSNTGICISSAGHGLYIRRGGGTGREQIHHLRRLPFHQLQVKLRPGRIQILVDDEEYLDDPEFSQNPARTLTFGQTRPSRTPAAFKCRNVRFRRLSADTSDTTQTQDKAGKMAE